MKSSLVLVMVSILVACLITGCGGGVDKVVETGVETYSDPDKTISTGVNKEFTIALDSNPTTGFQWEESYDESRLELVGKTYKAGEQTGEGVMIGAGGVDYFRFKVLRSGGTKLTFVYKRPWEITVGEQRVFRLDIK